MGPFDPAMRPDINAPPPRYEDLNIPNGPSTIQIQNETDMPMPVLPASSVNQPRY